MARKRRREPTKEDVEVWSGWLDDRIFQDVAGMHVRREIWNEQARVLQENPALPDSYYWHHLQVTYMDSQALAVRRMVGRDDDEISLHVILTAIRDNPALISTERHRSLYDSDSAEFAARDWHALLGEPIDGHVNPELPARWLANLESASNKVRSYATSHVAHALQRPRGDALSIKDLHGAVDAVLRAYQACNLMIQGAEFDPSGALPPDWSGVFDVAWRQSSVPLRTAPD